MRLALGADVEIVVAKMVYIVNFVSQLTATPMKALILIAIGLPAPIFIAAAQTSQLAKAEKAIICLTYGDGLDSHLSTVIPHLDSAGLKATFFLNSVRGSSYVVGQVSPTVSGWRFDAWEIALREVCACWNWFV